MHTLLLGKLPIVRDKEFIGSYLTTVRLALIVLSSLPSLKMLRSYLKLAPRRASQLILD